MFTCIYFPLFLHINHIQAQSKSAGVVVVQGTYPPPIIINIYIFFKLYYYTYREDFFLEILYYFISLSY